MKNFYTQCINSYNKNYDDTELLMNFINNFNISERLSNSQDGLTVLFAELNNNAIGPFFRMDTEEINDLPYKYIPSIKSIPFSNWIEKSALLEFELSKEGLSGKGNFRSEDDYNKYLQGEKDIIEKYKKCIKNIFQFMYGSDNDKIDTMVESVIEVERKLSRLLIE